MQLRGTLRVWSYVAYRGFGACVSKVFVSGMGLSCWGLKIWASQEDDASFRARAVG